MEPVSSQCCSVAGLDVMDTEGQETPFKYDRKHFTMKMVKHWSRLFRRVKESSTLEILRTQLDMVLNKLL